MAKLKIIVTIFIFFTLSCRNTGQEKYTRIWIQNTVGITDTLCDTTGDNFYDFTIKKTFFSDSIFDSLYKSEEYSTVIFNNISYYIYKRDEFFKNPKYKSMKVAVLSNLDSINSEIGIYYLMEHYGIVAIFAKKGTIDLLKIVKGKDTINVEDFYPR